MLRSAMSTKYSAGDGPKRLSDRLRTLRNLLLGLALLWVLLHPMSGHTAGTLSADYAATGSDGGSSWTNGYSVSARAESIYLPLTARPATATPPPTGGAAQLVVLGNHRAHINSLDELFIAGEVQNNTGKPVTFYKITITLYDAEGRLVATTETFPALNVLPAGERTCFNVGFRGWLSAPDYAYYTFETSYDDVTTETPISIPITLFGDSGAYGTNGRYAIAGQARNDGTITPHYVRVIGTLYHHNGQVLDCSYTETDADQLAPGQVSPWSLWFRFATEGTVGSYRLQAQGTKE